MNSMLADQYRRLRTELYYLRQINSADTEAKETPLVEEMVDIWYQLSPEDCETLEQEGFADPGSLADWNTYLDRDQYQPQAMLTASA